ncbi:MAG: DUF1232 domain-containing protein [Sphingomonadaceae bacterium]
MGLRTRAKAAAQRARRDAHVLWIAARDPRTPLLAKLIGAFVAVYVLSPIDLIPDFVPIIGLLDELILVPIGMWMAWRLVPKPLMAQFVATADASVERPVSRVGAVIIVLLWVLIVAFILLQIFALRYW